jgi:hypothetical protein
MEKLSSNQAWGGQLIKYKISSSSALGGLATQINVFVPPKATKAPVLYYLAGANLHIQTMCQILRDKAANQA